MTIVPLVSEAVVPRWTLADRGTSSTPTPTDPVPILDTDASACAAWATIWPIIDQATINSDLAPLEDLVAKGGPDDNWYALVTWSGLRVAQHTSDQLSDDVAIVVKLAANAGPGVSPGPLRAGAELVNVDCGS